MIGRDITESNVILEPRAHGFVLLKLSIKPVTKVTAKDGEQKNQINSNITDP